MRVVIFRRKGMSCDRKSFLAACALAVAAFSVGVVLGVRRDKDRIIEDCDDDDRSFVVSHMVDKIVLYGEI